MDQVRQQVTINYKLNTGQSVSLSYVSVLQLKPRVWCSVWSEGSMCNFFNTACKHCHLSGSSATLSDFLSVPCTHIYLYTLYIHTHMYIHKHTVYLHAQT